MINQGKIAKPEVTIAVVNKKNSSFVLFYVTFSSTYQLNAIRSFCDWCFTN